MLGRKSSENINAKICSVIGADVVMEGDITAKEALRIEGTIIGDVSSEGALIISASGKVTGNVKGSDILVAGTVEGDVKSEGKMEVETSGRVIGNVKAVSLMIDKNAVFQGQCTMNIDKPVVTKSKMVKAPEEENKEK